MPSSVPSIRYMGLLFHAMQPMAAGVRTAGPSRLRLVRDRRRAAINGRALVIACTTIYSGITGERGTTMLFYVCLTVYDIVQKNGCTIYGTGTKQIYDRHEIHDPTVVVRLFYSMPNNSELLVYDALHRDSYRFSKGTPLKSETDTDIDQFIDRYMH